MRPKKTRWIKCHPGERCFRPEKTETSIPRERAGNTGFRPQCKQEQAIEGVTLSLDEFEALRLCDLQRLDQNAIAAAMKVHRSTISRILASARAKVTDALVNLKAIKVAGGCCQIRHKSSKRR